MADGCDRAVSETADREVGQRRGPCAAHTEWPRQIGNRATGLLLQRQEAGAAVMLAGRIGNRAMRRVLARNNFLDDCVRDARGTARAIDYQALRAASRGALKLLWDALGPTLDAVLNRQSTLQALDDSHLAAQVRAALPNLPARPSVGSLAAAGVGIRSSHSGGSIDPNLPLYPYAGNGAPLAGEAAKPASATTTLRGEANWAWLVESTTAHTTSPEHGLPPNPARVASYFELHIPTIRHPSSGTELLKGGRLVYNPFAHTAHVSEHYGQQYEISNLPAPHQTVWYATFRDKIAQLQARNPMQRQFEGWLATLHTGMESGKA
jgi:hypothetical protein